MWKAILAGTTALAIAGSSAVYAQQRLSRPEGAQRWQPSVEDMRAFSEARLAALKAGLALTPDQEKNWPAYERAARDLAKLRLDRIGTAMAARRGNAPANVDPAERLRNRGTAMADTGAALTKLADAMDPLYKSLDDSQKHRFALLSRMGREGGPRGDRGPGFRGRGGEGRGGEGPGFRGRDGEGPRNFGPRRSEVEPRDFGPRRFQRGSGGFEGGGPADSDHGRRFEHRGPGGTSGTGLGEAL